MTIQPPQPLKVVQRPWQWIRKEATILTALSGIAIALFTGFSLYIDWKTLTTNQNVQEYIAGIRRGEYKIDIGNGEYIGRKLLVDDSKTPYEIDWYWKKNTEPSQITRDDADKVSSIAIPMNPQNQELLKDLELDF